jgi:hypothetical protein
MLSGIDLPTKWQLPRAPLVNLEKLELSKVSPIDSGICPTDHKEK